MFKEEVRALKVNTGGRAAPLWTKEENLWLFAGKNWDARCTKRRLAPTADHIELLDGCLMDVSRTETLHGIVALPKQAEGTRVLLKVSS